jgi:hypothetical protein
MRQRQALTRRSVHIGNQELDQLRAISEATGIPVAFVVRRAVVEYLERHRDELMTGRLTCRSAPN